MVTALSRWWLIAPLFALALAVGPIGAFGATRETAAENGCVGRNGQIAAIRTERGGDELGLLTEGRFVRLYKVPDKGNPRFNRLADPSFSCDGKRIVVAQTGGEPFQALVVVDVADRSARVVPTDHHQPFNPTFLADGRIVFAGPRIRHQPHTSFGVSRLGGTFEVEPDGSNLHRLFARQELAASRDGRFFVDYSEPETGRLELLDDRGRFVRFLAPPPGHRRQWGQASFSPNGRRIVLIEGRGENGFGRIEIEHRDRAGLHRVYAGRASVGEPSFSPDGRHIVFVKGGSLSGRPVSRELGPGGREHGLQRRITFVKSPIWGSG